MLASHISSQGKRLVLALDQVRDAYAEMHTWTHAGASFYLSDQVARLVMSTILNALQISATDIA